MVCLVELCNALSEIRGATGMKERFHEALKDSFFPPELLHIVALTQEVGRFQADALTLLNFCTPGLPRFLIDHSSVQIACRRQDIQAQPGELSCLPPVGLK